MTYPQPVGATSRIRMIAAGAASHSCFFVVTTDDLPADGTELVKPRFHVPLGIDGC